MPFCANCGHEISEGELFCTNCGKPVAPQDADENERKVQYRGKVYKCPNCGEVLSSYMTNCPTCGYEIRGNDAPDSVQNFYRDLRNTATVSQKDEMIRNFPIPNSKEDILEFMILASTNIAGEDDKDICEAWLAKLEQTYQKATLLFGTDEEFHKIQKLYDDCLDYLEGDRQRKIDQMALDAFLRNIAPCAGIVLMIIAVIMDWQGNDFGIFFQWATCILLVVSAFTLYRRDANTVDYLIGFASGLLEFLLACFLKNGFLSRFIGIIVLFIVAINYFRSMKKRDREKSGKYKRDQKEYDVVMAKLPSEVVHGNVENYAIAEQLFEKAGFTNVRSVPLNDLTFGITKKAGSINSITVNGKNLSSYTFKRKFDADVPVLITYHSMRS